MELDLASLSEPAAKELVTELLRQLEGARAQVEEAERRAAGIRKMIDVVVEMVPAVEDDLPDDLDGDEQPRPRGAQAVRRVLQERAGFYLTVHGVFDALERHGWLPESSNPINAIRTALERLVDSDTAVEKTRTEEGTVAYRLPAPQPPAPPYEWGEEPF